MAAELRKLAQPTVTEEHIIARARLPLRVNVQKRHGLLPQDNVHTCENCRNQNLSRRIYGFCPLLHTLANQTFPTVPLLHPILREPAQPHPGYAASACHVAEEDGPVSGACAAQVPSVVQGDSVPLSHFPLDLLDHVLQLLAHRRPHFAQRSPSRLREATICLRKHHLYQHLEVFNRLVQPSCATAVWCQTGANTHNIEA